MAENKPKTTNEKEDDNVQIPLETLVRRTLKFRGWNRYWHEMDYNIYDIGYSEFYKFMQFTGLKDKNGKDVYEGDIIKAWHWKLDEDFNPIVDKKLFDTCLVYYDLENCGYMLEGAGENIVTDFLGHCSETEVIGNIFENTKLLEEDEDNNHMCEDCQQIIPKEEWEMFGGKCEECNLQL